MKILAPPHLYLLGQIPCVLMHFANPVININSDACPWGVSGKLMAGLVGGRRSGGCASEQTGIFKRKWEAHFLVKERLLCPLMFP